MIGILILEIFLILILGVGVWGLGKLDKLQSEDVGEVDVNEDMDADTAKLLKGYTSDGTAYGPAVFHYRYRQHGHAVGQ